MSRGGTGLRVILALSAVLAWAITDGPAMATGTATHHAPPSNLLRGNAATFDTGTGGWTSPTARLAVDHTTKHHGTGGLAMSPKLQTNQAAARALSPPIRATHGGVYTASFWLTGSSVRSVVSATLVFTSRSGQVLATVDGATVQPTSSWAHIPAVTALAPRNTQTVQAVISIRKPQIATTLYVDDARLTRLPQPRLSTLTGLSVHGNHIVDANGHRVILKGINRAGLSASPTQAMTSRDVAAMAEWGVSIVRLPLSPQFWLKSGCAYDSGYVSRVDSIVRMLSARHIATLIDLQTVTPCNGVGGNYPMASRSLAVPFWHQVATRYRHNPLVAFDLFNEPHNITTHVWLHGGTISWGGSSYRAEGMQQMYDVVRRTGARNLVFVSGTNWSATPGGALVRGFNIVYAAHAYTCPHDPPPNCHYNGPSPYDAAYFMNRWRSLARRHPVLVTEFGWPSRDDAGLYVRRLLAIARSRGWGWAIYGYNGTTTGKFDVVGAKLRDHTYEPSPVGMSALRDLATRG
jgi:hypothetical protein